MARSKVKSRSDHDVAHLHLLTNVPTKYQLPTPYGFRDIAWTRFIGQGDYGKVKGQIKVTPWHCIPTPSNQCPKKGSTSYTLQFPRYCPDKIFKLKVTMAWSKVKSRSSHDVAYLHILTNVPTKYQLPTPYGFWDTARTNFFPLPTRRPIRSPWVKTIPRGVIKVIIWRTYLEYIHSVGAGGGWGICGIMFIRNPHPNGPLTSWVYVSLSWFFY